MKAHFPFIEIFLNNKKNPFTSQLFYRNHFIALFSFFFSKQSSLISNDSLRPTNIRYITDKRLSIVTFSVEDIGKIIQNFDSNKTHRYENISIPMIKIYVNHQRQSLITLYKRSPNTEFFLVHIFPYSIQIPENMDKKKLAFRPFSHSIKPFLLVCSF